MSFTIEGRDLGIEYTVDNTDATFSLEVSEVTPGEKRYADILYPSYAEAINSAGAFNSGLLPSIDMIRGKGKQFDDGLYAAIEEAAAEKLGNIRDGKVHFLSALYEEVAKLKCTSKSNPDAFTDALAYIATGLNILFEPAPEKMDEDMKAKVVQNLLHFEADLTKSKPIGFYTWTARLEQIFKSDRFYQELFDIENDSNTKAAIILSSAIYSNPALKDQYETIVNLYGKLTNPASTISFKEYFDTIASSGTEFDGLLSDVSAFRDALKETESYRKQTEKAPSGARKIGAALFPHSYSKETDLFNKTQASYETGDLMNQLINAIKSGNLSLEPDNDSGWYDHQLYALETLLVPEKGEEAKKLTLGEKYKKRLVEAFKTMITKARETHIKTLEFSTLKLAAVIPSTPIRIKPMFDAEPISTIYKRNALGYAFLKKALGEVLGEDALSEIYRLKEDGTRSEISAAEELDFITDMMYGFYKISADSLGMEAQTPLGREYLEKAESVARKWISQMKDDADLARDTRVIVPVHQITMPGSGVKELVNWATMGVRLLKVKFKYENDPKVTLHYHGENIPVRMHAGTGHALGHDIELAPREYVIPVDEFREIITNHPFTRAEWREICSRHKTADEIVAAIEGRTTTATGESASKVKEKFTDSGIRKEEESVFDAAKGLKPGDVKTFMEFIRKGYRK